MKNSAAAIRRFFLPGLLLTVFGVLLPLAGEAQKNCDQLYPYQITAPNGLTIRARPSLQGRVITYGLYRDTMWVCPQPYGALTVEGITGQWRRVRYKNDWGYAFDGFLKSLRPASETPSPLIAQSEKLRRQADSLLGNTPKPEKETTAQQPYWNNASKTQVAIEAVNYCGPVDELDPGLIWYGIYPADSNARYHEVRPVEMKMVVSQRQLYEEMEFDITTDQEERSLFLLGLNRPLMTEELRLKDRSEMFRYRGNRLLPGQIWGLGSRVAVHLFISGKAEQQEDCLQVSDYQIKMKRKQENGAFYSQDLTALLPPLGSCGVYELFWYGDLSGDGLPELILVHAPKKGVNQFHFLTSGAKAGRWKRAFTFTLPNCKQP